MLNNFSLCKSESLKNLESTGESIRGDFIKKTTKDEIGNIRGEFKTEFKAVRNEILKSREEINGVCGEINGVRGEIVKMREEVVKSNEKIADRYFRTVQILSGGIYLE